MKNVESPVSRISSQLAVQSVTSCPELLRGEWNVAVVDDDWERAKAVLQNLQTKLRAVRLDAPMRHEIENSLAISQANIEAVLDGVMEPTPDRLKHVQDALAAAASRLA